MATLKPGKLNLYIRKGKDFEKSPLFKADGQPMNLTGYGALVQARTAPSPAGGLVLEFSSANDTILIDAEAGETFMALSYEETRLLREGKWPWEMVLITPDNKIDLYLIGWTFISYGVIP